MTANHDYTGAFSAKRTSTGMLDHAVIESRARQLRSEALRALLNTSARRVQRIWAIRMGRAGEIHAGDRARRSGAKGCHC